MAGFDDLVVAEIKSGRMGKAMDLRDKLPVICAGQPKILHRYMSGAYDLTEAYSHAVTAGGEHHALNRLKRLRKWLADAETEDDLLEAPKAVRDSMQYELKEIERKAKKLKG